MNKLDLYHTKGLTQKQRRDLKQQLRKIETFREIVILSMYSLGEVDVYLVEMVSDTLEEAEDLIFNQSSVITIREKEVIDTLTNEYISVMQSIMVAHRNRIFDELEKYGSRLDNIDPGWRMLLPASLD